MVYMLQPLILTVNGHCKKYMKDTSTEWYSQQVVNTLHAGANVEGINIQTRNNQAIGCKMHHRVL